MVSQKGKLSKGTVVLLVVIAIFLVIIVIQAVMLAGRKPVSEGSHLDDPAYAIGADNTDPTVQENVSGEPLDTRYIDLVYPDDLKGKMNVTVEDLENGVVIVFTGNISGMELELFTITMSKESGEGFLMGVLKHETEGELQVTMQMNEQDALDWTEEEYAEINALQERVNDIIAQFYDDPRFSPSH